MPARNPNYDLLSFEIKDGPLRKKNIQIQNKILNKDIAVFREETYINGNLNIFMEIP